MFATHNEDIESGIPVLYMRVPNGRVFDLPDAQTATARFSLAN
jgi:hypothetical protein